MHWHLVNIQHYLGYQKTSIRISHVPQEEIILRNERDRMCQWMSTTRIHHKRRIKFANTVIVRPYGIMCSRHNGKRITITVDIPNMFLEGDWPEISCKTNTLNTSCLKESQLIWYVESIYFLMIWLSGVRMLKRNCYTVNLSRGGPLRVRWERVNDFKLYLL